MPKIQWILWCICDANIMFENESQVWRWLWSLSSNLDFLLLIFLWSDSNVEMRDVGYERDLYSTFE